MILLAGPDEASIFRWSRIRPSPSDRKLL